MYIFQHHGFNVLGKAPTFQAAAPAKKKTITAQAVKAAATPGKWVMVNGQYVWQGPTETTPNLPPVLPGEEDVKLPPPPPVEESKSPLLLLAAGVAALFFLK